tara:strand:- start:362 stop:601 length:240 start_codon:yes stop_codon:yes gene_type:complete
VKLFWPNRLKAKGFSIKNFACKDLKKTSNFSSNEISNQHLYERNLKSILQDSNYTVISELSIKRMHWANRDFSEYKEAA